MSLELCTYADHTPAVESVFVSDEGPSKALWAEEAFPLQSLDDSGDLLHRDTPRVELPTDIFGGMFATGAVGSEACVCLLRCELLLHGRG